MVRADAAAVVESLLERLDGAAGSSSWSDAWTGAERRAQEAIDSALGGDALNEPVVQRALGDVYGDGERVLIASSMPIRDAEAFLDGGDAAVTIHSNRGANGIDGLLSTAAGIAAGSGEPTWVVLGDLALAHDLGGLASVAAAEQPLRIVVVDNGGGGIFDFLPQAGQVEPERFSALFTTPSRLDVASAAAAYGIPYEPVVRRRWAAGPREPRAGARARADRPRAQRRSPSRDRGGRRRGARLTLSPRAGAAARRA